MQFDEKKILGKLLFLYFMVSVLGENEVQKSHLRTELKNLESCRKLFSLFASQKKSRWSRIELKNFHKIDPFLRPVLCPQFKVKPKQK